MDCTLTSFADDDPRMRFAVSEAKASLAQFFQCFAKPGPGQEHFLVKVQFERVDQVEHIWVADLDASVFPLRGTLANEPDLPGLTFMERVEFHPSQIPDWMYVENGYLVGGFTIQVIRDSLSVEERAAHDASAPYKFKDAL